MINECQSCPFFRGNICKLRGWIVHKDCYCSIVDEKELDINEAIAVLHYFQKYRRAGTVKVPATFVIGDAIDVAIRVLRKVRNNYEEIQNS